MGNNSIQTKDFQVLQAQAPCCVPGDFKDNGDPLKGCKSNAQLCTISTTTTTTTTLEPCPNLDGHMGVKELDGGWKCYGTAPSCDASRYDCWKNGYIYVSSDSGCRGTQSSCWSGDKVVCRAIKQCCDGYTKVNHDQSDPTCELAASLKDRPNVTLM